MRLFQNNSTRALIFIMIALVILAITVAKIYYSGVNNSVDPRIVLARELYSKYDGYASTGDFQKVFPLLDSIETEYLRTPHYRSSFEVGVLYNNRAAAQLTLALHSSLIDKAKNPYSSISNDSLVSLAEKNLGKTISIYNNWIKQYSNKNDKEIAQLARDDFFSGLDSYEDKQLDKFLSARAREIEKATLETDRRLSVCYTNLGIVYRERGDYEGAIKMYEKALDLWDRNLEAENNINRLLGRPLKKRNIIQKLFPPEREER